MLTDRWHSFIKQSPPQIWKSPSGRFKTTISAWKIGLDSSNLDLKFQKGQVMAWFIFNFSRRRIYELLPAPKLWKFSFCVRHGGLWDFQKQKKTCFFTINFLPGFFPFWTALLEKSRIIWPEKFGKSALRQKRRKQMRFLKSYF